MFFLKVLKIAQIREKKCLKSSFLIPPLFWDTLYLSRRLFIKIIISINIIIIITIIIIIIINIIIITISIIILGESPHRL